MLKLVLGGLALVEAVKEFVEYLEELQKSEFYQGKT